MRLAFISNDAVRRATYKKRRRGMMKKISELSTLCGVDACAIVYNHGSQPDEIWPSPKEVQRVLTKFHKMSEIEQNKKKMDQVAYLKQRIQKAKEQLRKKRKENRQKEMTLRMYEYMQARKLPDDLSLVDLKDLVYVIDLKMKEIEKQIKELEKKEEAEKMKKMKDFASSSSSVPPLEDGGAWKKRKTFVAVEDGNGLEMILNAIQNQQ